MAIAKRIFNGYPRFRIESCIKLEVISSLPGGNDDTHGVL